MGKRNNIIEDDLAEITNSSSVPWEKLQGKHVLVTGATGFIGGYLVDTLAFLNETKFESPVRIYALARSAEKMQNRFSYLIGREDFVSIIQDVNDFKKIDEKIDIIIHAASEASPKKYLKKPVDTIKTNTIGTINLLEIARQHNSQFLFLSSGAVYGNNDEEVLSETSFGALDPLHPSSCYSESKRLAETLCMAYGNQYSIHTNIARISHTYGPGLDLEDGRVFTDLIADAIADRDLLIYGDGFDSRPFCYVTDLVVGLFFVLFKGLPASVYNIGADDEMTILDLAKLIIYITEKNYLKIKINNACSEVGIRKSGVFNLSKIKKIGWQQRVVPEIGLKRMYSYCS